MTRLHTGPWRVLLVMMLMRALPGAGQANGTTEGSGHAVPAVMPPAPGRITLGGSFGDELHVYQLEAILSLTPEAGTMLFLAPRALLLEDEEQEAGVGPILRHLLADRAIIGGHAFYDLHETDADNTFHQVGGGVELLSRWVDARANYYHPLTDEKTISRVAERSASDPAARSFVRTEEALAGFDAEAGVWLPLLSRYAPTGIFLGYYNLTADGAASDVDGIKARVEVRPHPNVSLDFAWYEEDGYRNSEYVAAIRLHMPVDFWNGFRMPGPREDGPWLADRMTEPVHRDYRVHMVRSRIPVQSGTVATTPVPAARPAPVQDASEAVEYVEYVTLDADGNVVVIRIPKDG